MRIIFALAVIAFTAIIIVTPPAEAQDTTYANTEAPPCWHSWDYWVLVGSSVETGFANFANLIR